MVKQPHPPRSGPCGTLSLEIASNLTQDSSFLQNHLRKSWPFVENMVQRAHTEARNSELREAASLANLGKVSSSSWTSVSTSEIWWAGGTICGLPGFCRVWGKLLCAPCSALVTAWCSAWSCGPDLSLIQWPWCGVKRCHSAKGQRPKTQQRGKHGCRGTSHCWRLIGLALSLTQWTGKRHLRGKTEAGELAATFVSCRLRRDHNHGEHSVESRGTPVFILRVERATRRRGEGREKIVPWNRELASTSSNYLSSLPIVYGTRGY